MWADLHWGAAVQNPWVSALRALFGARASALPKFVSRAKVGAGEGSPKPKLRGIACVLPRMSRAKTEESKMCGILDAFGRGKRSVVLALNGSSCECGSARIHGASPVDIGAVGAALCREDCSRLPNREVNSLLRVFVTTLRCGHRGRSKL